MIMGGDEIMEDYGIKGGCRIFGGYGTLGGYEIMEGNGIMGADRIMEFIEYFETEMIVRNRIMGYPKRIGRHSSSMNLLGWTFNNKPYI